MQGDRHAVAGEGRDDGGLIANAPEAGGARGEVADGMGEMAKGRSSRGSTKSRRWRRSRFSARIAARRAAHPASWPKAARRTIRQRLAASPSTRGKAAIAAGEEKDLDELSQRLGLSRRELPVQFEADEAGLLGRVTDSSRGDRVCRSRETWWAPRSKPAAAQPRQSWSRPALRVFSTKTPIFYVPIDTPPVREHRFIQGASRERERGEGQGGFDDAMVCGESQTNGSWPRRERGDRLRPGADTQASRPRTLPQTL